MGEPSREPAAGVPSCCPGQGLLLGAGEGTSLDTAGVALTLTPPNGLRADRRPLCGVLPGAMTGAASVGSCCCCSSDSSGPADTCMYCRGCAMPNACEMSMP